MRLIDLNATFVHGEETVVHLADADGVAFDCPACTGAEAAHRIRVLFGETEVSGESIGTLTLAPEIHLSCWSGRIDCGATT